MCYVSCTTPRTQGPLCLWLLPLKPRAWATLCLEKEGGGQPV